MTDFLGGVGVEVVSGLIVAAFLGAFAIARNSPKRKRVEGQLRQGLCRHSWKPIQTDLGGGLHLVTQWQDECMKCGSRR